MAIKTVQAIINGQSYTLTLNSGTGKYEATITAPGKTSFNQPGGYYNVQVKATNEAGTVGTADASTMAGLKLVVRERVAPVITIISPSTGAYVNNSKQPVVFTVVDEVDGSGVDLSTLVVKQDGTAVASSAITSTAIANGYQVTYTPATALTDGSHTVTVDCKDHDGNAAAQKAKSIIEGIVRELKVGDVFTGKVARIMSFGAFVEYAPGKDGMIHISKLANGRVDKVEDVVKIGDELECKVAEIDSQGRINLIRNDIQYDDESMPVRRPPRRDGERGGRDRGGRPPRR